MVLARARDAVRVGFENGTRVEVRRRKRGRDVFGRRVFVFGKSERTHRGRARERVLRRRRVVRRRGVRLRVGGGGRTRAVFLLTRRKRDGSERRRARGGGDARGAMLRGTKRCGTENVVRLFVGDARGDARRRAGKRPRRRTKVEGKDTRLCLVVVPGDGDVPGVIPGGARVRRV